MINFLLLLIHNIFNPNEINDNVLENHKYFSELLRFKGVLNHYSDTSFLRRKLLQTYFKTIIDTELECAYNFLKHKKYRTFTPKELHLELVNFLLNMLLEEKKNCILAGLPENYYDRMLKEVNPQIEQMYDTIGIICNAKAMNHVKYNSNKVYLIMSASIPKIQRIEKKLFKINKTICDELGY